MLDRRPQLLAGMGLVAATICTLALSLLSVTACMAQSESEEPTRPDVGADADPESRAKGLKLLGLTEDEARAKFAYRLPPDDVGQVPEDAQETGTGLAYRVLESGDGGPAPKPNDLVTIHTTGWTSGGAMFESTRGNDIPKTFQVNRSATGVAEALQRMTIGSKWLVWLPAEMALETEDPPDDRVVLEIELLGITEAPAPPAELTRVPARAARDDSGYSYEVLKTGRGATRPGPTDVALVHYSGWTPDGKLSGSSVRSGAPRSVDMEVVLGGFREAILDMVVGEKRRVWVPKEPEESTAENQGLEFVWEIELLSFLTDPTNPPDDFEKVPEDARKTADGLAYTVLWPGVGEHRPDPEQTVVINYSIWDAEGKVVDSSFQFRKPVGFKLEEELPESWGAVVREMVEGEKRRVWIPEGHGMTDAEGQPLGRLVFEVDLVAIQ
jgi:peptidylprolyl isomerase